MSFPAYPAYKDSGVEWLGVVPNHWAVTLLKRGYEVVLGKMLQPEARRDDDEFLPYLRAANIQLSGVDTVDVKRMWFGPEEKKSLLLRRGDLLVSEGGDVGRSAIWDFDEEECYFQNSINRIRSIDGNNTRFLYFWMLAIKKNGYVDVLCNKSTIAHFTAEKVAAVPLPIPTKSEQTQIARFLDHETARIDALIKEQQRLIELLKEKRQAVISHAVTKGLDPTVPMKDSGVEWLGEVPAHWEVKQLKHVVDPNTSITYGIVQAGPEFEGGIPYIRTSDMSGEVLPASGYPLTSPDIDASYARSRVRPGDIVMSIRASVGKCLPIPDELAIANLTQGTAKISAGKHITQNFLLAFLNAEATQNYFDLMAKGATFREITLDALRRTPVLLPPANEQCHIDQFVSKHAGLLDETSKQAIKSISLLQERRSALISAAVTGKIDVRGWQPPASVASSELAQEAM